MLQQTCFSWIFFEETLLTNNLLELFKILFRKELKIKRTISESVVFVF